MRPLDSAKGNPYLLEIADVFEFQKHTIIEVGFCIKSSEVNGQAVFKIDPLK